MTARAGTSSVVLRCLLLLCACLLTQKLEAQAPSQVVDASRWQAGSVDLVNDWKMHEGDNTEWAQPTFDDAQWTQVELDNQGAATPGWRWYRLHFRLEAAHPHEHLILAGGGGVYAVYLNGQPVEDIRLKPWYAQKRPVEEVISLDDQQNDFTLALRTHSTQAYAIWQLPLFLTAAVGSADVIDNERVAFEAQRFYIAIPSIAINLLVVLAGMGAFALFRSQRGHREYFWLGLYLSLLGIANGLLYCAESGLIPLAWNNQLGDPLIYAVTMVQIEFTFSFAGQRVTRTWRAYQVLLLLPWVANLLVAMGWLSTSRYVVLQAAMILPAAVLLPILLLVWSRRGNSEARWLILPSLFPAATSALYDLGNASQLTGWGKLDFLENPIPIGHVPVQIPDFAEFLFVLAIGVVMFFRFTRVSREQIRVAAELEAAREIQQRLVPAQLPRLAGYTIEAAYFPALEVGGDFYQIFDQGDGVQLLVVGDVSGKGLKAAMTGTLALGSLHTLASQGLGPAEVLNRLNRQLVQSGNEGFVTCICARITLQGELCAASAGHLSPYRNGQELSVPAGLPLGIAMDSSYAECGFQLQLEDQLTLLSDGVVEAMDTGGKLFGFERTQEISVQPAEAIARAAQEFGQQDDITVLTVLRTAVSVNSKLEIAPALG